MKLNCLDCYTPGSKRINIPSPSIDYIQFIAKSSSERKKNTRNMHYPQWRATNQCSFPYASNWQKSTWRLRHWEFFHRTASRSLIPVTVPMYLRTPDSSVSNIILNRMPSDTWVYIALLYLAKGITNSEGLALIKSMNFVRACHTELHNFDHVIWMKNILK